MKDKHTINLILISSKWVIPSFGVCSLWINSGSKSFHLFCSGVQISSVISSEHPSKSPQSSSYPFHPSILSRHPFVTGVLHGGSSWFNSFFKCSSRFLLVEFKYLFFLRLEVQLILRILLKWSFAFLRSSQLSNHFRLWTVITLWSWDVTYKTTTSLFFLLLIFSTTPFKPSF